MKSIFSYLFHDERVNFLGIISLKFEKWLTFFLKAYLKAIPVRNSSSQLTHLELTLKLMESSIWGDSVSSQWTHKMSSLCELAASFHHEFVVRNSWDHPDELTKQWWQWGHCELVSCELTVLAHCDLTDLPHGEKFRWAHCENGISSHLCWERNIR